MARYRYYDDEGYQNEEAFKARLEELHNRVDDKTLSELLKIRSSLYRLKHEYEKSGVRYLECEYEIEAINGLIEEDRRARQ